MQDRMTADHCSAGIHSTAVTCFTELMLGLSPESDQFVPDMVRQMLKLARQNRVSDVHLVPTDNGLRMQWRIDGVLQTIAMFDAELSPRIIARLKVLCGLLTYRTDIPQEGRIAREHSEIEVRVTTFPTLYGEKAAVRLFAEDDRLQRLHQLGLSAEIQSNLSRQLTASDGVIVLTGPSGSGKTTTAYACLRDIVAASGETRSVMTLEDPVEVAVSGVTQSQVRTSVGFDLATGLRSLMRQDPDVIMVGEIRDPATAAVVFQAALTGHLVLTTFHAGSCIEAITRLLDLGIEPYLLRSSLRAVVCQRLLRKLSDTSDKFSDRPDQLDVVDRPGQLRYHGRMVLAEMLNPDNPEVAQAILQRCDARQMAAVAKQVGFRTLRDAAAAAVAGGQTSQEEVFRVLGQ